MESLLAILQRKSQEHPENQLLQQLISRIVGMMESPSSSTNISWDMIRDGFESLVAQGLLELSEENTKLLENLCKIPNKPGLFA